MDDLQHQPIEVPDDFQSDNDDRPSRSRRGNRGHSDKPKKKSRIPEPVRKFWRRYQLTKIVLILIGIMVLTVGGYLFFLAKTANVGDLQEALKATTIIYDKDSAEAGTLSGQKGTYVELDAISEETKKLGDEMGEEIENSSNLSTNSINLIEEILRKTTQVESSSKILSNSSENLQEIVSSFKIY